jgi:hypothetical protein
MTAPSDLDRDVALLAAAQHGVVAYRQLRECGLRRQAIAYRAARGRLIELYPAVYALGHAQLRREGRRLAAVLHGGGDAVLSHTDAAAHWGLMATEGIRIHVTTPRRSGREPAGSVHLHRVGTLGRDEVTTHDGVPVTTVARTIVDLAATKRPRVLEDVIAQADRLQLFDLVELRRVIDAHPRQRGRRALLTLLDDLAGAAPAHLRSPAERALLEVCDEAGIPAPLANVWVAGFEVDFVWPQAWLIVEVDGFSYHSMPGTSRPIAHATSSSSSPGTAWRGSPTSS